MSRSRPRVVSRCSRHTDSASSNGNSESRPGRRRRSTRRATSTTMRQSSRAAPGAGIAGRTRLMRRSLLVTVPLFSPQVEAGSSRSAKAAVAVVAKASCSTTYSARSSARRTVAWSGIDCAGFVHAIHSSRISPSAAASNISMAVLPGAAGTSSTPHSAATSARCAGLDRSRCADSRFARPPTSRPPIALGWPVSENGPAPGRPIWPVARCRLISAPLLAVPCALWLRPMQYSDSTAPDAPHQRAAVSRSSSRKPVARAVSRGVHSRTRSRKASKPDVCARMNALSVKPSHSIRCSSPLASATSLPGRICRCRSAIAAVSVLRGSTTIHFWPGRAALASSRRRQRMGWAHARLLPVMKTRSASAKSS